MSWFKKKGKYWYYFYRIEGKEKQIYVGNDEKVIEKLTNKRPNSESKAVTRKRTKKVISRRHESAGSGSWPGDIGKLIRPTKKPQVQVDVLVENAFKGTPAWKNGARFHYAISCVICTCKETKCGSYSGGSATDKEDLIRTIVTIVMGLGKQHREKYAIIRNFRNSSNCELRLDDLQERRKRQ